MSDVLRLLEGETIMALGVVLAILLFLAAVATTKPSGARVRSAPRAPDGSGAPRTS